MEQPNSDRSEANANTKVNTAFYDLIWQQQNNILVPQRKGKAYSNFPKLGYVTIVSVV